MLFRTSTFRRCRLTALVSTFRSRPAASLQSVQPLGPREEVDFLYGVRRTKLAEQIEVYDPAIQPHRYRRREQ